MRRLLPVFALVTAVLNSRADILGLHWQVYLFKPLATLALAAIVLHDRGASRYRMWIGAGLVASLAGDILLMLPMGLFVHGLAAFLVGHLCYIRAFSGDGAGLRAPLLIGVPVFAAAIAMLAYLWPSLGPMRLPVVCYVLAISTMSWQAIARWWVRRTNDAAFAAVGSLFFLASDSTLAANRFAAPFASAGAVVLVTYYAAQWAITRSASGPMAGKTDPQRA